MHASTPDGREQVGSECSSAMLGPRLVRGKTTINIDLYHHLPTADPGLTSQEGKDPRVSSRRLGPEARHPEYPRKERQEAQTKLGGPIHGDHQKGQIIRHVGRSRREDARQIMKFFYLK